MNEVIELIEEKIEEIKNYSISNQEDESQYMKELDAFEEMLRVIEDFLKKSVDIITTISHTSIIV